MFETTFGDLWDISYEPTSDEEVVFIDVDKPVYLTKTDLVKMIDVLDGVTDD
jgi:hypothetical protein